MRDTGSETTREALAWVASAWRFEALMTSAEAAAVADPETSDAATDRDGRDGRAAPQQEAKPVRRPWRRHDGGRATAIAARAAYEG